MYMWASMSKECSKGVLQKGCLPF